MDVDLGFEPWPGFGSFNQALPWTALTFICLDFDFDFDLGVFRAWAEHLLGSYLEF